MTDIRVRVLIYQPVLQRYIDNTDIFTHFYRFGQSMERKQFLSLELGHILLVYNQASSDYWPINIFTRLDKTL